MKCDFKNGDTWSESIARSGPSPNDVAEAAPPRGGKLKFRVQRIANVPFGENQSAAG